MGRTFRGDKRLNKKERQKVREFRKKRDHSGYYEDDQTKERRKKREEFGP